MHKSKRMMLNVEAAGEEVQENEGIMKDVKSNTQIWMSHSDTVSRLPDGSTVLAKNGEGYPVALKWSDQFYGIQFHPEVSHTDEGMKVAKRNDIEPW